MPWLQQQPLLSTVMVQMQQAKTNLSLKASPGMQPNIEHARSTDLLTGRGALPRHEAAHQLHQAVALLRHRRRLQAAVCGHLPVSQPLIVSTQGRTHRGLCVLLTADWWSFSTRRSMLRGEGAHIDGLTLRPVRSRLQNSPSSSLVAATAVEAVLPRTSLAAMASASGSRPEGYAFRTTRAPDSSPRQIRLHAVACVLTSYSSCR